MDPPLVSARRSVRATGGRREWQDLEARLALPRDERRSVRQQREHRKGAFAEDARLGSICAELYTSAAPRTAGGRGWPRPGGSRRDAGLRELLERIYFIAA
jgi:hypothetical protein